MEVISQDGTTAQIDPLRFCRWMLERCKERGVQLHHPARALSVSQEQGVLNGIRISQDGTETECKNHSYERVLVSSPCFTVPCTRLVITSGAWSPRVFNTLFPTSTTRIPISALGGHSLLVRNPHFKPNDTDKETCHAVFATDTLGFSPEWFARTGGELYLAGLTSTTTPLPDVATEVKASEKAIEQLKACAMAMMEGVPGKRLEVLREGLVGHHIMFEDTHYLPPI
jgi:glycine/D-amino acid oxidase-like deaminating enzyme